VLVPESSVVVLDEILARQAQNNPTRLPSGYSCSLDAISVRCQEEAQQSVRIWSDD
jgi:hypothetical protein